MGSGFGEWQPNVTGSKWTKVQAGFQSHGRPTLLLLPRLDRIDKQTTGLALSPLSTPCLTRNSVSGSCFLSISLLLVICSGMGILGSVDHADYIENPCVPSEVYIKELK